MLESFAAAFSHCPFLAVFLISLIPGLEARVAIPFALSSLLAAPLSPWLALLCVYIGSILPIFPVVFFTRKIKNRFFTGFLQDLFSSKLDKISSTQSKLKKLVLLGGFVAIPLPLTGVWSGSLIAGLTNLKIWQCALAIALGQLAACGLILAATIFFAGSELLLIAFAFALLFIFIGWEVVKMIIKKKRTM